MLVRLFKNTNWVSLLQKKKKENHNVEISVKDLENVLTFWPTVLLPGIYSEKKSQKKYKDKHTNMFIAEFAYSKILGNIQLSSIKLYIRVCMLSCFSHVQLFATLWTVARQATLFMGFSKQESRSELLCLPPGALSHPGIKLVSLMTPASAGNYFTTVPLGKPLKTIKKAQRPFPGHHFTYFL